MSTRHSVTKPKATRARTERVVDRAANKHQRQPCIDANLRLWRYWKPRGLITTHHDPQNRPTIFANLPPLLAAIAREERVLSVGRLDIDSEGLMLLTTSGTLQQFLERSPCPRVYQVRMYGEKQPIDDAQLRHAAQKLSTGLVVESTHYAPCQLNFEPGAAARNRMVTLTLTEGRNREVRRLMGFFGWRVNRLLRARYGPYDLAGLSVGSAKRTAFRRTLLAPNNS